MENQWLTYAKKLQSIASTGLHYTSDEFDKERYDEILQISLEMMSNLSNIPVEHIDEILSKHSKGHATPKVDVRGAVFKDNQILLVKEKSDGLWTLPGGFADIGITASQNIEKEIKEEATLNVKAQKLYAIKHKASWAYKEDARDFYKLFFICKQLEDTLPKAGAEVSDVGFFSIDNIPPLSTGRVIESDIHEAFSHAKKNIVEASFD